MDERRHSRIKSFTGLPHPHWVRVCCSACIHMEEDDVADHFHPRSEPSPATGSSGRIKKGRNFSFQVAALCDIEVNISIEANDDVVSAKIRRRTCYECGERQHISSLCPKKNADNLTNPALRSVQSGRLWICQLQQSPRRLVTFESLDCFWELQQLFYGCVVYIFVFVTIRLSVYGFCVLGIVQWLNYLVTYCCTLFVRFFFGVFFMDCCLKYFFHKTLLAMFDVIQCFHFHVIQ